MGLGFVLWLLVEGIAGRAATALDAILGIAWGIAVETANDLPAEDQTGAGRLIDELIPAIRTHEDSSCQVPARVSVSVVRGRLSAQAMPSRNSPIPIGPIGGACPAVNTTAPSASRDVCATRTPAASSRPCRRWSVRQASRYARP